MQSAWFASLLLLACRCTAQSAMKSDSSPIAKVIVLITEMKATAEKEAADDKDAYDKYSCWSITNEKEKRDAIAANEANVQTQENFIEQAAGTTGQLTTEIKGLKSDIEEDQEALDSANAQREKESEAFQAEEADMKETIGLLKQALEKLQAVQLLQKKGHSVPHQEQAVALLQVKRAAKSVRTHPKFNNMMQKDLFDILGSLETVARKEAGRQGSNLEAGALLGEVFLPKRGGESNLLQNLLRDDATPIQGGGAAAGAKSYNAKSGPIVGILAEMKDEFERNLATAQKEDFTALVNFQKLNAAKNGEVAASTAQQEMKEGQLADLLSKTAEAKESLAASNDALTADNTFLTNLLASRKKEDEDYNARVATRSDEVLALGETLKILTDDSARELFGKTISFLQVATAAQARERMQVRASKKAMRRLMDIGKKHKNMALIGMAVRVRMDAFTKVKASMSQMVTVLKAQQAAEYTKWEECKKEIDTTEDEIKEAQETKSDLAEKKQELTNTLSELASGTKQLQEEVASMEVQMKKAGEARKSENTLFQNSVSDQRATVQILGMAKAKLTAFYNAKSFVQTASKAKQAPATAEYEKSAGAGGVMQLLSKIITDAEVEEQQLKQSEGDSQAAYADFVKDTTASMETARKAITQKAKQGAAAKSEKSETEGSQIANDGEIAKLQKLLMGSHQSCDYLLKFFDTRQKARSEEMDAIGEATAILSGASFQ